jgi:hypothetical protein
MLSHYLGAVVSLCDLAFHDFKNDGLAAALELWRVARHSSAKKQQATAASASVAADQKLAGSCEAGMLAVPT